MSAAVVALPAAHIDVVPIAEDGGPFGVVLVRGRSDIVISSELALSVAVSTAIEEARSRGVEIGPDVALLRAGGGT